MLISRSSIVVVSVLLAACGGGGGGEEEGIVIPDISMVITSDNVESTVVDTDVDHLLEPFMGAASISAVSIAGGSSIGSVVDKKPRQDEYSSPAMTESCAISGTVTYVQSVTPSSINASGSFDACRPNTLTTLNGSIRISNTWRDSGSSTRSYTSNIKMDGLSITVLALAETTTLSIDGEYQVAGSYNWDTGIDTYSSSIKQMTLKENGVSLMSVHNATRQGTNDEFASMDTYTHKGTYTSHLGTFYVESTTALKKYRYNPCAHEGVEIITGVASKARLTYSDGSNIFIEVDADGDDYYESSKTVSCGL